MSTHSEILAKAQRHLARRDKILRAVIKSVGPCTLRSDADRFGMLVRSIISQQISTKAARAISARLEATLGEAGLAAAAILALPEDRLRAAGLSASKARSLGDLAGKVHGGVVALEQLHEHDDETVIEALLPVRGIGRWTAQMFLIFSLGRLDVLPVDDFGLRKGILREYGLQEMPDRKTIEALAESWRPYRTVATWYMWRSLGAVPQSD